MCTHMRTCPCRNVLFCSLIIVKKEVALSTVQQGARNMVSEVMQFSTNPRFSSYKDKNNNNKTQRNFFLPKFLSVVRSGPDLEPGLLGLRESWAVSRVKGIEGWAVDRVSFSYSMTNRSGKPCEPRL